MLFTVRLTVEHRSLFMLLARNAPRWFNTGTYNSSASEKINSSITSCWAVIARVYAIRVVPIDNNPRIIIYDFVLRHDVKDWIYVVVPSSSLFPIVASQHGTGERINDVWGTYARFAVYSLPGYLTPVVSNCLANNADGATLHCHSVSATSVHNIHAPPPGTTVYLFLSLRERHIFRLFFFPPFFLHVISIQFSIQYRANHFPHGVDITSSV